MQISRHEAPRRSALAAAADRQSDGNGCGPVFGGPSGDKPPTKTSSGKDRSAICGRRLGQPPRTPLLSAACCCSDASSCTADTERCVHAPAERPRGVAACEPAVVGTPGLLGTVGPGEPRLQLSRIPLARPKRSCMPKQEPSPRPVGAVPA